MCLELAILAARETGRLPVEVVFRDEEIAYPGTIEYVERVSTRPEVAFHWLVAHQPIINVFNRELPYFWVFDPLVHPDIWVRSPPACQEIILEINIDRMTIPERFPPPSGKRLFSIIGLRGQESRNRMYGIFASKGALTKPNRFGVSYLRPIYDWLDGDIWKAIGDFHWDYNVAYDTFHRLGISRTHLRIGPPSMTVAAVSQLALAAQAWPQWFTRVCTRLPGVRAAVYFGKRAVQPDRRVDETWEACFRRECLECAHAWIAARAQEMIQHTLKTHARHSTRPFPEITPCDQCTGNTGSWRALTFALYNGDPFSQKCDKLPYEETREIVDGEHRWRAAAQLGFEEIPVVFVTMTPEQMRIATLRHNRARGSEDIDLTAALLRDLRELGALDWAQDSLMLDDVELTKLLEDVTAPEALAAPEYSQAWVPGHKELTTTVDEHDTSPRVTVMTPQAVTALREQERKVQQAKTEQDRAAARQESQVFQLTLTFANDEAVLVRKALGSRPAEQILAWCHAHGNAE